MSQFHNHPFHDGQLLQYKGVTSGRLNSLVPKSHFVVHRAITYVRADGSVMHFVVLKDHPNLMLHFGLFIPSDDVEHSH